MPAAPEMPSEPELKTPPESRRHELVVFNPGELLVRREGNIYNTELLQQRGTESTESTGLTESNMFSRDWFTQ